MRNSIIITFLFFVLVSCKTSRQAEYIYVDRVHNTTDTVVNNVKDFVHDSVFVYQNDTLKVIKEYHTKGKLEYKYISKHDTLYRDSIQTKTITVYKEKPISKWLKVLVGLAALGVVILMIVRNRHGSKL